MSGKRQSGRRDRRIVANLAHSYAEAEQWDLAFWQQQAGHYHQGGASQPGTRATLTPPASASGLMYCALQPIGM